MSIVSVPHRGAPKNLFGVRTEREGVGVAWLVLSFVVAALLIFSRSPSFLTHAQFYYEDGRFFADAYNHGWLHAMGMNISGYLVILQRITAGLALIVPLRLAPLSMSVVGLLIQALPVPFLLSERLRLWAPLSLRAAFAAVYVGIPAAAEIQVQLVESQWHLALVLAFILFATPPRTILGKASDVALVSIGALTGPYGIVLLPLAIIFLYVRRQRWTSVLVGILTAGSVIQAIVYLMYRSERHPQVLNASLEVFIKILGGNGFIGALLGSRRFGVRLPFAASLGMLLIGIALSLYCATLFSLETRLFVVYCFLVYALGMRSPLLAPSSVGAWPALLELPSSRYYYFARLPFLFSILWCAGFARQYVIRGTAAMLTLALCVGICLDWRIPPRPVVDSRKQILEFEAARSGQAVVIPIYGWDMTLIKK